MSDTSPSMTQPSFSNFFALFEQPAHFDIDAKTLQQRLRDLQKQFHPDTLASDTKADVSASATQAQQNSALINHAYNTLINPDSRASYLLEMAGQELNANQTIADLDFLDSAMDLRIRLDDATTLNQLNSLKNEIQPMLDDQSQRFINAYQSEHWDDAIDATQKLKFLVKLEKDVTVHIDEWHHDTHNDDDLYL